MKVTAIVPVLNEYPVDVCRTVRGLNRFCDYVIVVDGGMEADVFERRFEGLHLRAPEGLGPSYLKGWEYAHPDHWVLHVDIGHRWKDARRLVDTALDFPDVDVVIGSRFCSGGSHVDTWRRRTTSKAAAFAMNTIHGETIRDWTSGMRVYSPRAREVLTDHQFTTSGHAWQMESLAVCVREGLSIREEPIVYEPSSSHLGVGRMWEAAKLVGRTAVA